jgi:hypothetical protein
MLSVSLDLPAHIHVGVKAPAVHVPAKLTAPVNYAGVAMDAGGGNTELLMTVVPTAGGYNVVVHVMNPDGSGGTLMMKGNATGLITYSGLAGKDHINFTAQLSADFSGITGSFTSVHPDGTTGAGTISLSKTTVAPVHYAGTAMDSKGGKSQVFATVTLTATGYVALVRVVNPNGHGGGVTATGDLTGHFVYDGPNQDEHLHFDGELTAAGKTFNGSWTSMQNDGSMDGGTFTMKRA